MTKKILVAFDGSEDAAKAVEFIAESFKTKHQITLFSVIPDIASLCEMTDPSLTPYFTSHQGAFCAIQDKKTEVVNEAMQQAKTLLMDAGFEEENITTKVISQVKGIARDILNEAHAGYDTVVLGRRGHTQVEELFLGSVSQKVLHRGKGLTVLVVS